ncbi:MAG TPA: ABC transporter ATP-binding protein [Bacteroidetes bacterium]|nr:ABC transporter ATP-binding protein [Bacteroidota bacterium]
MIEVRNLTRYYGDTPAIVDVSFDVEKGEVLGFLGPNAAGKTTTMRILTCYMPATSGTARVAGFDVFEESLEVRKRIGYLPENPPLYPDMTVESYLDFVAKIKGVDPRERKAAIDRVVDLTSIQNVRKTIIAKLSKGFRQRVGLAQAIIHNPEVLILDEPTVGLDPKQIIEVRKLIKDLGNEHTIILSTHILPEVSQTCDRVVIINEGRVVAEDTPDNLSERLQGAERILVQVDAPPDTVLPSLKGLEGVTNVKLDKQSDNLYSYLVESTRKQDLRKEIAQTVVNNGWGLYELRPVGMSLEEVFLRLTTKEEEVVEQ